MSSTFSDNLRILNAEIFKETLSSITANNKLYLTFGHPTPWANEAEPTSANSSIVTFNQIWDNMLGARLLTGNDVRNVIPRIDWQANTIYQAYHHATCDPFDIANNKFYVLTSDWNVYKCLSNNYGANSTVMPTQIFTDRPIEEADGYIWKFMFNVPEADRLRFTTEHYIPIKTLRTDDASLQWMVQDNATEGAIEIINVLDGGQNYTNANNIIITITGDGTGAMANARVNTITNTISHIIVTARGQNYTRANVSIIDGLGIGSGALAEVVIPPAGGHGADPLRELGGHALILNPRLGQELGKFPTHNDYRQAAIIANPLLYNSSNAATNVAYSQFMQAIMSSGAASYVDDEIVYQGTSLANATFTGVVSRWDGGNNTLNIINIRGAIQAEVLIGRTSGTAKFVETVINPELEPYTGQLLYLNNMTPITRSEDQVEDYKIILRF